MSSKLKRTKLYFLVLACFTICTLILCSYKFKITDKTYKILETNVTFRVPVVKINQNVTITKRYGIASPINIRSVLPTKRDSVVNSSENSTKKIFTIPTTFTKSSILNGEKSPGGGKAYEETKLIPTRRTRTVYSNDYGKGLYSETEKSSTENVSIKVNSIRENPSRSSDELNSSFSLGSEKSLELTTGTSDNVSVTIYNSIRQATFKNAKRSNHSSTSKTVFGRQVYHTDSGFQKNRQRLLQSPNNLKAYLMKLGLPHHVISQITNVNKGSHLSELTGTARPDVCKHCFKNDFRVILDEPDLCEGEVLLLIMISSSVSKRSSRDAIRQTWGSACNKPDTNIKCLFMFGKTKSESLDKELVAESHKYRDIVQHDFLDTYANLTYKTMAALKWADEKCPEAGYVMKTDDDVYVNTELLPMMLQAAPSEKFMGGHCWGPSPPHRERKSKWYVSFQQYSRPIFPAMCSGTGYVMSGDVVHNILIQSKNIPFFYLEDVYIALCLKKIDVRPIFLQGFQNTIVDFIPCNYRNRVLTSHGLNEYDLVNIWTEAQNCEKEDLTPSMLYIPRPY